MRPHLLLAIAAVALALWVTLRLIDIPPEAPPQARSLGEVTSDPEPQTKTARADHPARATTRALAPRPAAAIRARVVDGAGHPVSGAELVAESAETLGDGQAPAAREPAAHGRSDADGRVAIEVPADEVLVLHVTHREFPRTVVATRWTARAGESAELGDLVLYSRPGILVEVRDAAGPVEGARLELAPAIDDAFLPGHATLAARRYAVSGPDGSALLHAVDAGSYTLRVDSPLHATWVGTVDQPPAPSTIPRHAVQLVRGLMVRGRTYDPEGAPLGNVRITACPVGQGGPVVQTRSGSDGAFRLGGLAGGYHELSADHLEYGTLSYGPVPAGAGTTEVELRFPSTGVLQGVILGGGQPIAGAHVHVEREDGWPLVRAGRQITPHARSDAKGRFRLRGLPPGRFRVRAESEGWSPTSSGPHEPDGPDLRIEMVPPTEVRGLVLGPDGRPIRNATVLLLDHNDDGSGLAALLLSATGPGPALPRTATREDGTFVLTAAPRGAWRLAVRASGLAPGVRRITLREAPLDLGTVRLTSGATVLGTALDAEGRPLAGVTVCLDPLPDPGGPAGEDLRTPSTGRSDASGAFRLGPVPAGRYEVFYYSPELGSAAEAGACRSETRSELHLLDGMERTLDLRRRKR